jgi:hypothetical protein
MEFRQNPNAEWTSAEWTAANGPLPTHSDKKDGKEGKRTGMTHPAPKTTTFGRRHGGLEWIVFGRMKGLTSCLPIACHPASLCIAEDTMDSAGRGTKLCRRVSCTTTLAWPQADCTTLRGIWAARGTTVAARRGIHRPN